MKKKSLYQNLYQGQTPFNPPPPPTKQPQKPTTTKKNQTDKTKTNIKNSLIYVYTECKNVLPEVLVDLGVLGDLQLLQVLEPKMKQQIVVLYIVNVIHDRSYF